MKRLNFITFLKSLPADQKGFSLAEIMVAAGMLGVLSLGVSQLMQNSTKTEKRLGQQMNLVNLEGDLREALKNPVGCGRTFLSADIDADDPQVPTTDMGVNWTAVPDGVIYRANNPEMLDDQKASWGVALRQWVDGGPLSKIGVYGDGSNTVSVRSIEYRGFYNSTDNAYNTAANYNAAGTAGSLTPVAGAGESIGTVVVRVRFSRGNYAQFNGMTDVEAQRLSNKLTTGPFIVTRFFPLRVRVNTTTQRLVRCLSNSDDILAQYCTAMGGIMDEVDGRCKNIKISDIDIGPPGSAEGQDNDWAISAQNKAGNFGGNIIAEHSIGAGYEDDDTATMITGVTYNGAGNSSARVTAPFTESSMARGDIRAKNNITADNNIFAQRALNVGMPISMATGWGDASIGRDLRVDRDNYVTRNQSVGGFLNVGGPATPAATAGDTSISRDLRVERAMNIGTGITTNAVAAGELMVRNRITVGQAAMNTAANFRVGSGYSQFVDGTVDVLINNTGALQVRSGGTELMRINNNGTANFYNGGTAVLEVGVGTGTYRPIRISNQSTASSTMTFTNGSTASREVPTKQWVRRMVFGSLESNPGLVQSVVDNITQYAQHNTLDAIRSGMCTGMRLTTAGQTSTCTYNTAGNTCTCQNTNCSQAAAMVAGSTICGAITSAASIVASTFMRAQSFYTVGSGAIPANGDMRAINLRATNRIYATSHINVGGNAYITGTANANRVVSVADVTAGSYLRAGSYVVGSKICAQGGTTNYYCFTKMGKFICNNSGFMIGIAYGHPVCARSGSGSSSAVRY